MVVEQRSAKWRFRAFAARDLELLARELLLPFGIGLHDWVCRDWPDELASLIENTKL